MQKALSIRMLLPNECDVFAQHLFRQMADSGLEGGIIFHPYEPGSRPSAESLADGRRLRWVKQLDEPGWSRAFGAFDEQALIAHVEIDSVAIESGAHRGVLSIGIEPAYRGSGLGERISRAAIDWARTDSALEWIDLFVFSHNQRARNLYQRLGFTEAGITRDRFRVCGQSIDDVHMTLQLKPDTVGSPVGSPP